MFYDNISILVIKITKLFFLSAFSALLCFVVMLYNFCIEKLFSRVLGAGSNKENVMDMVEVYIYMNM